MLEAVIKIPTRMRLDPMCTAVKALSLYVIIFTISKEIIKGPFLTWLERTGNVVGFK